MSDATGTSQERIPIVTDPTRSQSESIETVLNRLKSGRVYIPDYQRDSGQWDTVKESLFIESVINNLTVPAFFLSETSGGKSEVVDGQQRLTTLLRFFGNELRLAPSEDVNYLIPASIQYAGRIFSEIEPDLQQIFQNYPLTIIYLPRSMNLSAKLEVFRRINEGGTPLTGQDIRLAYYSQSAGVNAIRLTGIHNSKSDSAKRMIDRAAQYGLSNPWDRNEIAREYWEGWWEERDKTKGQTPSHMFLWYLVALSRDSLDAILKNTSYLKINFRGTIDEALDIYCAQLLFQEQNPGSAVLLPTVSRIYNELFDKFAKWVTKFLGEKIPNLSIEKYRQLALFAAAAVELGLDPDGITDPQWAQIGKFIQNPRDAGRALLGGEGYPEPKGRWTGQKGQKVQCDKAVEAVRIIVGL